MLLAGWSWDQFIWGYYWISLLGFVVIHYAKKLKKAKPAVKDAANNVAASEAID
jgi:hypothetical protein